MSAEVLAAIRDARDAASALDDSTCVRTVGEAVADVGWSVADYAQFGGDAAITAALARSAASASRQLGSLEGNRLADAMDALAVATVECGR